MINHLKTVNAALNAIRREIIANAARSVTNPRKSVKAVVKIAGSILANVSVQPAAKQVTTASVVQSVRLIRVNVQRAAETAGNKRLSVCAARGVS